MWDRTKKPSLDEGEEPQVSDTDQIFKKIIGKKCPQTKGRHAHADPRRTQNMKQTRQEKENLHDISQ